MPLERIPIISEKVFNNRNSELIDEEEFNKYIGEIQDYLLRENRALYSHIEGTAMETSSPDALRHFAYTLLELVNNQLIEDDSNNNSS